MPRQTRTPIPPTEEWSQLELLVGSTEQRVYGLMWSAATRCWRSTG